MIHTYKYKNVSWIDLENPSIDEIRDLVKKYDIHPLAAEELLSPSSQSKVDNYPDFIHIILHFPAWKHFQKETTHELDVLIGKEFLITARYATIEPLHKFAKMFEVNAVLEHNNLIGEHAGYAFYYLMREMYNSLTDELESVKESLDEIEKKTFKGQEQEMVFEISKTSREILTFKHTMASHHDVLESFATMARHFFGADYGRHIEAITGEYSKVEKTIHSISEFLTEIRQTNNSLLEAKQNRITLVFTSVTIISSFVNVMASWFLIESPDSPIGNNPHEFWLAGLIMLSTGLLIAAIMKSKRWL